MVQKLALFLVKGWIFVKKKIVGVLVRLILSRTWITLDVNQGFSKQVENMFDHSQSSYLRFIRAYLLQPS